MPKRPYRSRMNPAAQLHQEPRRKSRTAQLKQALHRVLSGKPYDRNPCPHTLRTPDLIEHPQHPGDPHRAVARWTEAACVRPGSHERSSDPREAVHAADDGRTWE